MIFAPTKGSDHVNASMKFGSQYGCDVALYCLSAPLSSSVSSRDARGGSGGRAGGGTDVPDGDALVLVLDHRAAVVVHVEVVGRAEDRDHRRELLRRGLAVHRVPRVLRLVPAEDAQQLVALQELARRLIPETQTRARERGVVSNDMQERRKEGAERAPYVK